MKTKMYTLLMIAILCGCHIQNKETFDFNETADTKLPSLCPTVEIVSSGQKIIQKQNTVDAFLIEIIGSQGHCHFDENLLKDTASVAPRFKITRLNGTNVEDVHFSYYLETGIGPEKYLGRKTFFGQVRMPKGLQEIIYTPEKGTLSISAGAHNPDIYIGLYEDKTELQRKVK